MPIGAAPLTCCGLMRHRQALTKPSGRCDGLMVLHARTDKSRDFSVYLAGCEVLPVLVDESRLS